MSATGASFADSSETLVTLMAALGARCTWNAAGCWPPLALERGKRLERTSLVTTACIAYPQSASKH